MEKELLIEIVDDDDVTSDRVVGFVRVQPEEMKRKWIQLEGPNTGRILMSMSSKEPDNEESYRTSLHFSGHVWGARARKPCF